MNDRSRLIFRAIVEEYLKTGEPVGSRTISRLGIPLSPATIRNVMSDLEDLSLLVARHTSAGRLPTQRGLRMYVDGLMEIGNLTFDERAAIESHCQAAGKSMTELYDTTTTMLAGLSSCVAMVIAPKTNKPIRQIQFVGLERGKALVIIVLQDGVVENRVVEVPHDVTPSMLQEASNYLTAMAGGKTLEAVREEIKRDIAQNRHKLHQVTAALIDQGIALPEPSVDSGHIFVRGQSRLLSDVRAVENIDQARQLLEMLEEQKNMAQLLDAVGVGEGVQIFIGSENKMFEQSSWSTIISPYKNAEGHIIGALGVIGPTRLNYGRIIPIVDYTSQVMGKILGQNF